MICCMPVAGVESPGLYQSFTGGSLDTKQLAETGEAGALNKMQPYADPS